MSDWLSAQELLNRWNLKPIELLNRVIDIGLQPYKQNGFPEPCPEFYHELTHLEHNLSIIETKLFCLNEKKQSNRKTRDKKESELKKLTAEKSKVEKEIIYFKEKYDGNDTSWEHLVKPKIEAEINELIELINNSIFKRTDVKEIEKGGTPQHIELMKRAKPEIEVIYAAVKKVGRFGQQPPGIDDEWKNAALLSFKNHKFDILKGKYLEEKGLYNLSTSNPKRDFVGFLLKEIYKNKSIGQYNKQKLFNMYSRLLD